MFWEPEGRTDGFDTSGLTEIRQICTDDPTSPWSRPSREHVIAAFAPDVCRLACNHFPLADGDVASSK
ncbi:MAG TPA: hypothetical protein VGQ92_25720, partial [Actinoplanes sp.]|nr:hypothetical protein [Actinoplanes sp.]